MTREKIRLKFIFQNHDCGSPQTETVATALRDCQIIFLEAVSLYQTALERQDLENKYNFALAKPDRSEKLEDWRTYTTQLTNSVHPIDRLIGSLAGTNIRLYLVDSDSTCDFFPLFGMADTCHTNLVSALKFGQLEEARGIHHQLVSLRGELHRKREELVKSQIETILAATPEKSIDQAAIVQGSIHQPTAALFYPGQFEVDTLVINPNLSPEAKLWLKKRQGLEIPELDYQKALISCYLLPLTYDDESVIRGANPTINHYLARLVDNLTIEQIKSIFAGFEISYKQKLAQLSKNRRPNSNDRITFGPFAFALAATETFKILERLLPR